MIPKGLRSKIFMQPYNVRVVDLLPQVEAFSYHRAI